MGLSRKPLIKRASNKPSSIFFVTNPIRFTDEQYNQFALNAAAENTSLFYFIPYGSLYHMEGFTRSEFLKECAPRDRYPVCN
ncbi:hypothetical protein CULT_420052 [[Clostridium] ultunense Esp]|nr:hypothetical protein CULT_420052 [[Clostridium] ultunense Esp]